MISDPIYEKWGEEEETIEHFLLYVAFQEISERGFAQTASKNGGSKKYFSEDDDIILHT